MALEIERRFLVQKVPTDYLGLLQYEDIRQHYLADTGEWVMRVRRILDRRRRATYRMTMKRAGRGIVVNEVEVDIPQTAYDDLVAFCGPALEKKRFIIPHGALVIELDQFKGAHAGLWIAEVEFPDLPAAEAFEPPAWFGQEITGDKRFSNYNLAQGAAR